MGSAFMPSTAQRQGPLDHLGLAARTTDAENAGIRLRVLAIPQIIAVSYTHLTLPTIYSV